MQYLRMYQSRLGHVQNVAHLEMYQTAGCKTLKTPSGHKPVTTHNWLTAVYMTSLTRVILKCRVCTFSSNRNIPRTSNRCELSKCSILLNYGSRRNPLFWLAKHVLRVSERPKIWRDLKKLQTNQPALEQVMSLIKTLKQLFFSGQ